MGSRHAAFTDLPLLEASDPVETGTEVATAAVREVAACFFEAVFSGRRLAEDPREGRPRQPEYARPPHERVDEPDADGLPGRPELLRHGHARPARFEAPLARARAHETPNPVAEVSDRLVRDPCVVPVEDTEAAAVDGDAEAPVRAPPPLYTPLGSP
ncbi:hypothetical protein BSZ37_05315 [Rubrivirga marina]|uniref:Uncharacterized protein n=1 Tax=Rubrivirga marina TaxID=1196024 RepID=A0A271IY63_9BACT|nr:hypothetical protein BSZ37_05315 [Rubrivirga marina]